MPIKKTDERVDINKRRVINGEDADVIQLYPMKHVFDLLYGQYFAIHEV